MSENRYDFVVIGAGPGGYVAAIRAAQLGMKVAIVDKQKKPGGTCLRIGCIPSKALLESSAHYAAAKSAFKEHGIIMEGLSFDLDAMMKRKTKIIANLSQGIRSLFKKNKIDHFIGTGRFVDSKTVAITDEDAQEILVEGSHILIATGSKPKSLPGVNVDGDRVLSSTEALSLTSVPKHLVIIGAGAIGLELGSVWQRFGSKITVVEFMDRILVGIDSEIADQAKVIFVKQGFSFHLGAQVRRVEPHKDHCLVAIEGSSSITCDRVLVAVGRQPSLEGLQLDQIGIEPDKTGRIPITNKYETTCKDVYAIGDVIEGPMLAHKAEEEGVAVAEHIAGNNSHVDYRTIPNVVYTHPEISSVGATEDQLREQGIEFLKGLVPFKANGRAHTSGFTEGFVKVLAHSKTDRILGVHIIGPQAGELINEAAIAMAFGASSEDLGRQCHAHPTLSEMLKEAALATTKNAIHV